MAPQRLIRATILALSATLALSSCAEEPTVENNSANNSTDLGQDNNLAGLENSISASTITASPADLITIDQVTSVSDGWLTIHDDRQGLPNNLLAVVPIDQGTSDDITITLDRYVLDGETLHATLHVETAPADADEDAPRAFTFGADSNDPPALDQDGDIVTTSFIVSATTPTLDARDQPLDDSGALTIASASLPTQGFVALFAADTSSPTQLGALLGHVSLDEGTHEEITVTLDTTLDADTTIIAQLHADTPADMMFDHSADTPTQDPPILVLGDPVQATFTVTLPIITPTVAVLDQEVDPDTEVIVPNVTAAAAGFIVIHEDDMGSFGDVIGHASVAQGDNADVVVTLDRAIVDGETLYAMLHTDDNENQTYDGADADLPVVDDAGDVIAPSFVVTLPITPTVRTEDQAPDPLDEVTVSSVTAAAAGFIVIHEDDAGAPGEVLGAAAIARGENTDVVVALSRDVQHDETLHAMLHTDDNENQTFDGVDTDLPVTDDAGDAITSQFIVSAPAPVTPAVTVTAQTLDVVSTRVSIDTVTALTDGFVVIHEDDMGSFGAAIGHATITAGDSADVVVELERPLADGEQLYAMLHTDADMDGVYTDAATDPPVTDDAMQPIAPSFTVTVPTNTPAVIFTLGNNGATDYSFTQVEPSRYESLVAGGVGAADPTLTLAAGWRYRFTVTNAASHPLEFGDFTDAQNESTLLSQATGATGTLEADASTAWIEENGSVEFTTSAAITAELEQYRCANHPGMLGEIVIEP